jgi:hypothetical protein
VLKSNKRNPLKNIFKRFSEKKEAEPQILPAGSESNRPKMKAGTQTIQ